VDDIADLDAAVDELAAGRLEVVHYQQQPLKALGAPPDRTESTPVTRAA